MARRGGGERGRRGRKSVKEKAIGQEGQTFRVFTAQVRAAATSVCPGLF